MKIFKKEDEKVNFVDINNVLIGYDMRQDCCEYADWFISETKEDKEKGRDKKIVDYSGYVFDVTYFEEIDAPGGDAGKMVRFKLMADNKPDLYLHIFNCHNGYYGHGFEATINGKKWKNDYL